MLISFLHHTSKRTENLEPSKNNLLSGQGFEAKMRLLIEFRSDHLIPSRKHFCIVKGNYLPSEYKNESYVLNFDSETMRFENTDERMPFELLAKTSNEDGDKMKYKKIVELQKQGLTQDQIAKEVGYASKGSISKLLTKGKTSGWD